jgi:hypothetical protein
MAISVIGAFKEPRTNDSEFEKMNQEYQMCKERMFSLKKVIDSFPERLEGYKLALDNLVPSLEKIFDKEQPNFFQFMTNVASAHKALNDKLSNMFTKLGNLKSSMNKWTQYCSSVDGKISQREEKRKKFDYYDEKMAEIMNERNKIITKGKVPGEKDDDKLLRNAEKYQNSGKEYVDAANDAYRHICYFLDSKYENISFSIVEFIEIEAAFYNEASFIFNYFKNIRNIVMGFKKKPIERNYDASNNIRGKDILHWDIEKIRIELNEKLTGIIGGNTNISHKSDNEFKGVKTFNQTYNQKVNLNNNTGNMHGFNQTKNETFLEPYNPNPYNSNIGKSNYNNNNNYGNNNNNYVQSQIINKFDNSIPDPFVNQSNNNCNSGILNPYGTTNIKSNDKDNRINPYNQGNNCGDNPFDHPNI